MRKGCDRLYQFGLTSTLTLLGWMSGESALAQITPDETLGNERSVVRQGVQVRGGLGDRIEGGAQRGANLFHSFQEFNIGDGQRVYFGNPDNVANILSRVTGGNPSNILGTLGVDGAANLFFLNPNGILFGPNASLDVNGSFVATTADAIGFGEQGFFSATNPEVPSGLLTIDPSAFFFNQIPQGSIVSRSVRPDQQGNNFLGLRVPDGENLLLLGGSVSIDGNGGGGLYAFGGRIDIGAVGGIGSVGLNADSSLSFPNGLNRANVSFTNQAQVYVLLDNGGNIAVTAGNIDVLEGSALYAGIFPGLGSVNSQAGNVKLDATGTIQLDQSSTVRNAVFADSVGNAGNIEITAGSLLILNGAQLQAIIWGQGDAGNILINASNRVTFRGSTSDGQFRSSAFNIVDSQGNGASGNIEITSPILELFDGAQLSTSTSGQGDAGNVIISASSLSERRGNG